MTRRRLLDGAAVVFEEKGYFDSRVEDIAAAAGTSRATLYHYFADKEEVALELLLATARPMVAALDRLDHLGPGAVGRLAVQSWLAEVGGLYDRHPLALALWARIDGSDSRLGRLGDRYLRHLTDRMQAQLRRAGVEGLDLEATAIALLATVEREQLYRLRRLPEVSSTSLAKSLGVIVHRMLFPAPAQAPAT